MWLCHSSTEYLFVVQDLTDSGLGLGHPASFPTKIFILSRKKVLGPGSRTATALKLALALAPTIQFSLHFTDTPAVMAKRPAATNGALSRIASQNKKQATESRPKKSKVPKTAAPVAESLFDEKAGSEGDEDVWGDESDVQMNNAPIIEGKTGKKSKKAVAEPSQEDGNESSEDDSDSEGNGFDLARLDESDSESELEDNKEDGADKEEAEEEEEEEIDVDDLSIGNSSDEEEIAATTRVRQTINNKPGLLAALRRINLDVSSSVPFAFHQSVVSSTPTADAIPSVDDDLQRELAFMNQSLEAALKARTLLCKEGVPFTRPTDYFAETVRSDETMEKVKAKMIDVATAKKAAAEARKQRDLKKFGKQVQVAKQQERAKQKKETLDKIHLLKKSAFYFRLSI